jgi:mRNA-degrading endonuclease toxin of MazEF toxin-antitoxin module
LIVSPDSRNEFANSVLAVPITTNLKPSATHVALPAGMVGLAHNSMARCENVGYIHKSRLQRGAFRGVVSDPILREIERGLMRALGMLA